ncbi:uncharacterized protein LOC127873146 isoform X4 [Dreissena polymorpha]|uniref:uncharacterized protein LOC127873146 isoform X4 n=1 Tax=Dreissena polymorpha TaxID=45954 RepID=UPI002265032E|nr:uncharacterized protein LOC127873146 isoform X4 [Dreissena polymorpha]
MTEQNFNRDRSWIGRQRPIDVKLSNYAGFYDTRCLWNARNQLQNTVQLQNGFVWDRIIRKTGMNNQRPWDIWGHHSTYFSEAGLVPNMEDNAENNQQVSQERTGNQN